MFRGVLCTRIYCYGYFKAFDYIKDVLKYRSALSGKMLTIFPGMRLAICWAAHMFAPEEIPTKRPCRAPSSRVVSMAS